MTKQDLVNKISQKSGIEKSDVSKTIESLMDTIKTSMIKNQNVYLRRFGSFIVKKRAQKTARNISKNTILIIPEHFVPAFKPASEFVESIKTRKV